jgi:hypothetical protein
MSGQRSLPNEYDVYRAALEDIEKQECETHRDGHDFVLLNHTSIDRNMSDAFGSDYKYLTRLFVKINKTPVQLGPFFQPVTFHLVSKNQFDELMSEGERLVAEIRASDDRRAATGYGDFYWRPFYKRYPNSGGIYKLSRVAFSNAGTLAMLQIQSDGGGCDFSQIQIRRKVREKWVVQVAAGGGGCA